MIDSATLNSPVRIPRARRISNGVFAFAEFRTPEETDAALQLDGVPCAGSVLIDEGGPKLLSLDPILV